jgi:hypothetical protein
MSEKVDLLNEWIDALHSKLKSQSDAYKDTIENLKKENERLNSQLKKTDLIFGKSPSIKINEPICVACKQNLVYYDGWHCYCEDADPKNWINFDECDKKVLEEDKKILQVEIVALRAVISKIACNLGNGSVVSEEASLEFIQMLPDEVKLVVEDHKRQHNLTRIAFRELFQGLKKLVESFEKYLN